MTESAEISSTQVVDVSTVINGLDFEIRRLKESRQPPGWTNWAVLAGIGTLLWALAGQLSSVNFSALTVRSILAFSLVLDALLRLRDDLVPRNRITSKGRYVNFRQYFAKDRPEFLLYFVRGMAIIGAAWWLTGGVANSQTLLVGWAYLLMSLAMFGGLVFSVLEFTIRDYSTTPSGPLSRWLSFSITAATWLAAYQQCES